MDSILHNKTNATHPEKHQHQQSTSDLFSSAKLLAEAATATLHHESDKVDKGRVSGAAADLLDAASHYGKLEETSYGQYIEKAENYLRHSSHSTTTTTTTTTHGHHAAAPAPAPATTHSSSHSGGDGNSEGGYGDYFKMAQVDSAQGKDKGHGNSVAVVVGESMSQKIEKDSVVANRGGDHATCSVGQT
ncbi:hypothetical protein F0562_033828 [Nyssa sinensis]|uniref:Nodulin-related protein 1 n=1 Tax=Nyssa sinensis TaxID=561372 RepID=A0A5J5AEF9_9ASTE|nr:hypothetical protein F0562_033828 [Nyssa sinensis]